MIQAFLFFFLFLISGCTMAGDLLSGSVTHRDPALTYPSQLSQVHIGTTTKGGVRNLFGNPTDLQVSAQSGKTRESWAYVKGGPSINPLQYIPGFGVWVLPKNQETLSFSVSFSSEGIVDGIALREVQPYGEVGALLGARESASVIHPYGRNNPLTHHARHDASFGLGMSGE